MTVLHVIIVGKVEPYITERDLAELGRERTITQIAEGQFENLHTVIEVDLHAGTSKDVTREMAREVMTRWAIEGEPLSDWQYDFIEHHVSMNAARSFRREAEFA
jgi:hypothetical protein